MKLHVLIQTIVTILGTLINVIVNLGTAKRDFFSLITRMLTLNGKSKLHHMGLYVMCLNKLIYIYIFVYFIISIFMLRLSPFSEVIFYPTYHQPPIALVPESTVTYWMLGGALSLIFCIHVHSRPIYWGVIYLAKRIIMWWYFICKHVSLF